MAKFFVFIALACNFFTAPIMGVEGETSNNNTRWENVLLVIHYNHPHYGSVNFLRELYTNTFPNIIFYGDGEDPHNQVQVIPTYHGFFFCRVVTDVLRRYPNYEGYIFLQDDCILNYWNFTEFNLQKIWFAINFNNDKHDFHSTVDLETGIAVPRQWPGWDRDCGLNATIKAIEEMPKKYRDQLEENIGTNRAVIQVCNMFYLPGKYNLDAIKLCDIFSDVFCENAIPNILCALDSIDEWERLQMLWNISAGGLRNYPYHVHWVHPVKFSDPSLRSRVLEIFKKAPRSK